MQSPDASEIKTTESNSGNIIGDVIIGKNNPSQISKKDIHNQELVLYHGAAKKFSYSPEGKYDLLDTGGDGTTDYGAGLYTTDEHEQADNYSMVRGRRERSIVYTLLPLNAKMLDVRDKNESRYNGTLPHKFVQDWVKYTETYINTDEYKKKRPVG